MSELCDHIISDGDCQGCENRLITYWRARLEPEIRTGIVEGISKAKWIDFDIHDYDQQTQDVWKAAKIAFIAIAKGTP